MTTDSRCPEAARLPSLLDGNLAPDQEAALAEHLRTCESCRLRLDELTGKLGLLPDQAKADVRRQAPPEPALQGMIADLQRRGPCGPGTAAQIDQTVPADRPSPTGDVSLGFLDPPDHPGCLGKLGGHEITGVVGHGGMGVVLKGFDAALNRYVAIKVLTPQLASTGAARKRFSAEAKNAAAISHDHVVTIHAVGEANGMPYLVMEYIMGVSLEDRIRRTGPLKVEEILRIGMQAAAGLAAAHAQGLVHRDIKPANILLENGVERVKLTDFGLSRVVHEVEGTQSGVVAGTPQYMSPEQARGEPIDRRSDLFSLGCVLYAMGTGHSPFRAASVLDAIRRVCDDTPRPIRETNPDIPDWLVAIIDRLLAKKPEDRFQTAGEVAELLGNYLAHVQHPSQAALPTISPHEPKPRLGRRWRSMAVAASAAAVLLGLIGFGVLWKPTSRFYHVPLGPYTTRGLSDGLTPDNPQDNLAQLQPGLLTVDGIEFQIDPRMIQLGGKKAPRYPMSVPNIAVGRRAKNVRVVQGCGYNVDHGQQVASYTLRYDDGTTEILPVITGRHVQCWWQGPRIPKVATCAKVAWTGKNDASAKYSVPIQVFACSWKNPHPEKMIASIDFDRGPSDLPLPFCLAITCDNDPTPLPPEQGLLSVNIERFVGAGRCEVLVSGSPLRGGGARHDILLPPGPHSVEVRAEDAVLRRGTISITPGNRAVVVLDCTTYQSPLADPQLQPAAELLGQSSGIWDVAFSPDGSTLVTAGGDGTVVIWCLQQGTWVKQSQLPSEASTVRAIAFSPKGSYLALATEAGAIRLWDIAAAKFVATLQEGPGHNYCLAFSPDGKWLASGGDAGILTFWDVATRRKLAAVQAYDKSALVHDVAFSPDGSLVATSAWSYGRDIAIKLWDTATRGLKRELHGHTDKVPAVAFSPGGKILASAGFDSTLKLWDVDSGRLLKSFPTPVTLLTVAFSPDGKRVAAGGDFHTVHIWDVASGAALHEFHAHWAQIHCLAFAPDGNSIVSGATDNTAKVWQTRNLPGPFVAEFPGPKPLATFRVHMDWSYSPSFPSHDPNRVAAVGLKNGAPLWELTNFSPLGKLNTSKFDDESVWMAFDSLRFSPDGGRIFTCETRKAQPLIGVWDTRTCRLLRSVAAGPLPLKTDWCDARIAISPDGRTLAVISVETGLVSALNTSDFHEKWPAVSSPHGTPRSVAFSSDGQTLAVGTDVGMISFLDAATGKEIASPLRHGESIVQSLAFAPRGGLLASANDDGTVILYDTGNGKSCPLSKAHAEKPLSAAFSPDGSLLVTTGGIYLSEKAPWSHKGEVCLWDVATKKLLTKFHAHYGSVTGAAFSPDGKRLATTGRDGKMHLWDVAELSKLPAEK